VKSAASSQSAKTPDAFLVLLGEVVGVHINPTFLKEGIFDTAATSPLARYGYSGGDALVGSTIEMPRPTMLPTRSSGSTANR
jgi:flavin reductase (DIM6/NTAB) family NADH-FMN oxidoreductase RutF